MTTSLKTIQHLGFYHNVFYLTYYFIYFIAHSEQIGQFQIGVEGEVFKSPAIGGLVFDKTGTLHVLTLRPMELHSFYPVWIY